MLKKDTLNDLLYRAKINSIQLMTNKAEILLNPCHYHLSKDAKKRLRWLYLLYHECDDNVTRTANKIGISRQWLSTIKSLFERNDHNPRSLEPESRAPYNTSKRERILRETEDKIIEIRDEYGWGKEKISVILNRDYGLMASPSTTNRYLHKHSKIDPTISERNERAWQKKKERETSEARPDLKVKYRPPSKIKDYLPGALIEKDMKLVPKISHFSPSEDEKYHIKDYFYFQHTFADTFTRIRGLELSKEPDSKSAREAYKNVKERFPFDWATANTDHGSENAKQFAWQLEEDNIVHFYSRQGTPTDNPRVERSHLTDEKEFYGRGNICSSFEEQSKSLKEWEHIFNNIRPHQALGQLTPMEFYELWKKDPESAYKIVEDWQTYLKKQGKRLANSRKLKKRKQIDKLVQFIEAKLSKKVDLEPCKLELVKCQLCSWT